MQFSDRFKTAVGLVRDQMMLARSKGEYYETEPGDTLLDDYPDILRELSQGIKSIYEWLLKNAADYGFILRYPKDRDDITGYNFEPWHWRYVGVEAAREIMDKDIVLEEYNINRF